MTSSNDAMTSEASEAVDAFLQPAPSAPLSVPAGIAISGLHIDFVEGMREIFEEKIVFNQVLGLRITAVSPEKVSGRIDMQPRLVGHYAYNRLHGGAISAALDAMGGLAAMAAIGHRYREEPVQAQLERFIHLGTIDLRVDFLRQGIGSHFLIDAEVLRLGSRVASIRMEMCGPSGQLMATGSAAYIIS